MIPCPAHCLIVVAINGQELYLGSRYSPGADAQIPARLALFEQCKDGVALPLLPSMVDGCLASALHLAALRPPQPVNADSRFRQVLCHPSDRIGSGDIVCEGTSQGAPGRSA